MPNSNRGFDVAFSFSAEDAWIGKDMASILRESGLKTYFSKDNQDFTGGFLRKELMDVYKNSSINVMLLSMSYMSKPKDSVVAMERNIIWQRHIGKNEHSTLFVILIDDVAIPEDFELCLAHNIKDIGILKSRDFIINRLIDCFKAQLPVKGYYAHPQGCEIERGKFQPCKFRLSSNFRQDPLERWKSLSDMMVVPINIEVQKELKTYLIPSGAVPPFLSHSTLLKTDTNCLALKLGLSLQFFKNYAKDDLDGVLFYIRRDGMEYPHVYCYEYDRFLCENYGMEHCPTSKSSGPKKRAAD